MFVINEVVAVGGGGGAALDYIMLKCVFNILPPLRLAGQNMMSRYSSNNLMKWLSRVDSHY